LLRRFAFAEDDFGIALPQCAMMIHFGEIQILEWKVLQTLERAGRRNFSGAHRFQYFLQFVFVHEVVKTRAAKALDFATGFNQGAGYGTFSPISLRSG
jgi:hypothetical protein